MINYLGDPPEGMQPTTCYQCRECPKGCLRDAPSYDSEAENDMINYLEQVLGRTPNWQDRELWFSISNNRWELLTLKYKAQPQEVLLFPFYL